MKTEHMIHRTRDVQKEIQFVCEQGYWASRVVRKPWPINEGTYVIKTTGPVMTVRNTLDVGITERTISMRHCAIESKKIEKGQDEIRPLSHAARHLWEKTFQRELIRNIETHIVRRGYSDTAEPEPRKINFFGKVIPFYRMVGLRKEFNPWYKWGATQEIYFHPETVEFLFPNPSNWAGEVTFLHGPGTEPPRYRVMFRYAARPVRPDIGMVVTVIPPGLLGWLWFWAWKITRFVP